MKEEIVRFFDTFVKDFKDFDGAKIANRYLAPYTAISSENSISIHKDQKEIEYYFEKILTDYKKQGVTHCSYTNFEFYTIGKKSMMATLDWKMMNDNGTVITNWRESYVLILDNAKWKIITSIDH